MERVWVDDSVWVLGHILCVRVGCVVWCVCVVAIIVVCGGWYIWCFWVYINGQVCVGIYKVSCSLMI